MLAVLLALLAAAPQDLPADDPKIVFDGNVVLPDGVYLAALDLPHGTQVNASLARTTARKLRTFLRKGGYDLSSVTVALDGDTLRVHIDEGRLDKIVFLGEGVLETVRLKLELELPGHVFNRDLVERKLRELAPQAHIKSWRWELVPVESAPTPRVQVDEIEPLKGLPFILPGRPYQLFIWLTPEEGGPGWSPEIEIDSLEGGGVGAEYRAPYGASLGGRVAAAVRNHLTVPGSDIVLSRAWAEGRYRGLHLFGADGPQPVLRLRADFLNRQRADLNLERFDQLMLGALVSVEQPAGPYFRFGVGAGALRRFLYGLQPIGPLPPVVLSAPKAENRVLGQLSVDLDTTPDELRRDRHRTLTMRAYMFPSEETVYLMAGGQSMTSFGWHELWLRGSATALLGNVPYADEVPLGEHVHGPFAGLFTRKLAMLGAEYRYSLLRDIFKMGPYLEAIAFRNIDRATDDEARMAGAVGGLMAEGLFFDQFVFEAWLGYGILTDGRTEAGAALAVRQAY